MMVLFPFSSKIFVALSASYLLLLHYRDGIQRFSYDFYGLHLLLLSLFSAYCLGYFFHFCFKRFRYVYGVALACLSALYSLLSLYHYRSKASFSFSILADNLSEAFSKESFGVMVGMFKAKDLYQPLVIFLAVLLIYFLPKFFKNRKLRSNTFLALGLLVFYLLILFCRFPNYEEFSASISSVRDYYFPRTFHTELYDNLLSGKAPVERSFDYQNFPFRLKNKPHIFIIAMESFSADYVGKQENGKEITPFFNSLISKGVYAPHFFSNSIQTAKGHFALNCGMLPLIRDKAFYLFHKLNLECMASVLKKDNYKSIFFQHYGDENFDQTKTFMLKNGYDYFFTANPSLLTKEEREKYLWGWGVQDDISFKQFFKKFDDLKLASNPSLSFIATISHHMRFRSLPKDQWDIYPEANGEKRMSFINSLHAADGYLKTFFDELEKRKLTNKSIVILVGDHGYPNGQHGNFHSETGAYQESFAVPFLIYAPAYLKPLRLEGTYSQVDVLPTIYSLLGLKGKSEYIGESVFDFTKKDRIAHLIQPYDGVHLTTISYPLKYSVQLRTGREVAFDLDKDSDESNDIIDKMDPVRLNLLRNEIGRILFFDEVLRK